MENDLALLKLSQAIEPRENIIPACLHEKKEFLVGLRGWVTGERSELSFSRNSLKNFPDPKLTLKLDFFSLQVHNDVLRISMHCKQLENSSSFWIPQAVLYKCYTQYKKDL